MNLIGIRQTAAVVALGTVLAWSGVAVQAQTLRWASQGDSLTMDPHSQNETLTNSINGQVYDFLVARGKNMAVAPALATEWQQVSPQLWRMKLRQGVKFHDGTPFTADDVVFSINRAKQPTSNYRAFANAVGEPRKVDDHTVEFQLPAINPIFLEHLTTIMILSKSWSEKNKTELPLDYKNKEEKYTALHANGTGPFMLVSRAPDVKSVFKRNPNYWGKLDGNVQEVICLPIKSDATRTAALLSGEVDLVLDPAPQDQGRLANSASTKVVTGPENRIIFIGMDQFRDELLYSNVKGKNPFKDVRVRRALYQAVDIQAIKNKLMRGLSAPTGSITPSPQGSFNDPEIEARLPFDVAKAKALMAEAGYPQGFEVQLDCPNNRYVNDEEICVALASMWEKIGVKVKVNAIPRAQYFAKAEKQDISMYMLGWGGSITDADYIFTGVLKSRGEGGRGYNNYGGYADAEFNQLADASGQEPDPEKRKGLIKAALKRHADQVLVIPLHRQVIPWAMRKNVEVVHRPDNWLNWQWVQVK